MAAKVLRFKQHVFHSCRERHEHTFEVCVMDYIRRSELKGQAQLKDVGQRLVAVEKQLIEAQRKLVRMQYEAEKNCKFTQGIVQVSDRSCSCAPYFHVSGGSSSCSRRRTSRWRATPSAW